MLVVPHFDMFDYMGEDFEWGAYLENKMFFHEVANWFYFKNDQKRTIKQGLVCAGSSDGSSFITTPNYKDGAVVLKSDMPISEELKDRFKREKHGILRFKLKDGEDGSIMLLKHEGITTGVGLIIKNFTIKKKTTYSFPFSKRKCSYLEASKEEGTIPHMVENELYLDFLPDNIIRLLSVDQKELTK